MRGDLIGISSYDFPLSDGMIGFKILSEFKEEFKDQLKIPLDGRVRCQTLRH